MNTVKHSYLNLSRKTTLLKAEFTLPEDSTGRKKTKKIDQVMQHFMGNDSYTDSFILVPLMLVDICLFLLYVIKKAMEKYCCYSS